MACGFNESFQYISSNSSLPSWTVIGQFSSTNDLEFYISQIPFRSVSYQTNHEIQFIFCKDSHKIKQQLRKYTFLTIVH